MRLGMGLFTHFSDTQTFSKITGCQLVQKQGRRIKRTMLAKSEGVPPATSIEPNLPRQRAVEAVAGGGEAVEEGGEKRRGGEEAVVEEDDGARMEVAHDAVSHAGFPVWAVAMHCVKAPYAPADSLESEAFHGAGNRGIYNAERWTEKPDLFAGQCFQSLFTA